MELRQLQSFVAVVRCGSFTKAAEQTYTSQPTVSTHVHALEEELQVRLLERNARGIELTVKGRELFECASQMLALQNSLLKRWETEAKTILRLGASSISGNYVLPELLSLYGKTHPETYFTVQQDDSREIADSVKKKQLDLAIVSTECKGLHCLPLCRDRIVLITPVTPRFLAMQELPEPPIQELLREPILLRESKTDKRAGSFLAAKGFPEESLRIAARLEDREAIKRLVAGGQGIAILSERAARDFVLSKRLLLFPFCEKEAEHYLYLLLPKEASEAAMLFARFALDHYADPATVS